MEIGFLEEEIDLRVGRDGVLRTTKSILTYYSESIVNQLIVVPVGFETDLGSIPQFLQGIFPKDGKALFAYVLHDYLYKTGMFTRAESDDMLKEAMKSLNVVWWRVFFVRKGLKVGGGKAWKEHRQKQPFSYELYNKIEEVKNRYEDKNK